MQIIQTLPDIYSSYITEDLAQVELCESWD